MMDGEEEEEVRPKRGKSIRLPEDHDLEAQRYVLFRQGLTLSWIGLLYFRPVEQGSR